MLKKIGTDDLRKSLGKILDSVNLCGDEFIIQRKHQPLAALVPIAKFEALEKVAREVVLAMLTGSEAKENQDEIDRIANGAKHKSRKKKRQK